ncbi:hypothetical protein [Methylobacterium sp. WCS2018Hpa-22]|uniref:hypothetical protein n=1 Tax=Methylobacterium sp. WCS2018Hpa-22 TaxID=3073633 RepID=UPI002889ACBF|nr:hypothetical protein [Methylobacterium sp. WCS2018Hpa-22]
MNSRTSCVALICATIMAVGVGGCNAEPVKDDWVVVDKIDPIDDHHDQRITQRDQNGTMILEINCVYRKQDTEGYGAAYLQISSPVEFLNKTRFRKNKGSTEDVLTFFGHRDSPTRSILMEDPTDWLLSADFQELAVEVTDKNKRLVASFTGFKSPSSIAARDKCKEKIAGMRERNERERLERARKIKEESKG